MQSLHGEGMAQDDGHALFSAQIGTPRPGAETFDRHDQALALGGNRLEKRCRSGLHSAVSQAFLLLAQDADVHAAGMQVDTTVKGVVGGVEAHEVFSSCVRDVFPRSAYHWGMVRRRPQSLSRAWSRR